MIVFLMLATTMAVYCLVLLLSKASFKSFSVDKLMTWKYRLYIEKWLLRGRSKQSIKNLVTKQIVYGGFAFMIPFLLWPTLQFWAIPLAVFFAVLVFFQPIVSLKKQYLKREEHISRVLPFYIDMLILSLESGMSLNMALSYIQIADSPLAQEIEMLNHEIKVGVTRMDAFHHLSERSQACQSLMMALIQAEQMGMSLAPLLKDLANQMRQLRFIDAEKRAMQAPVKMMFPLLVCIFPCTFICIAFPLIMRILDTGVIR
ncbi:type II secretion system F family protein [Basilea psittacipulmonis]|uniref:type II secretion system F family protein n=1 Tax=Basilea psittacipulmonis TaxID=1472345 RepID=UPI00068BB8FC|nr:type II secretion system F family protein [Basilea psittacipulmonis]